MSAAAAVALAFLALPQLSGPTDPDAPQVANAGQDLPLLAANMPIEGTPLSLDLNGNAFLISGEDHDLTGAIDTSKPTKPGIASPAPVADLESQVPANRLDQIQGTGGTPSIATVSPFDPVPTT